MLCVRGAHLYVKNLLIKKKDPFFCISIVILVYLYFSFLLKYLFYVHITHLHIIINGQTLYYIFEAPHKSDTDIYLMLYKIYNLDIFMFYMYQKIL